MRQVGVEHIPIAISRSGMNPVADARLVLAYRRILRDTRPFAFLGFHHQTQCLWLARRAHDRRPGDRQRLRARHRLCVQRPAPARRFPPLPLQPRQECDGVLPERRRPRDFSAGIPGAQRAGAAAARLGHRPRSFRGRAVAAGPPAVLLAARLLADKGVRLYVEAARQLREQFPETRFRLLGPLDSDNPTAIAPEELDRWASEGAIEYCGRADDVRPFIKNAAVVVLPSYYREGVPHILLEAAAMGRPVITTDTAGCREAVDDGATGFLCAPRSVSSLVEAIARMLELPAAARERDGPRRPAQNGGSVPRRARSSRLCRRPRRRAGR